MSNYSYAVLHPPVAMVSLIKGKNSTFETAETCWLRKRLTVEIHLYILCVKQCWRKATNRRNKTGRGKSNTDSQMSANEDIASCRGEKAEEMGEGKLTFLIGDW